MKKEDGVGLQVPIEREVEQPFTPQVYEPDKPVRVRHR
jgi:hypothetical protein